MYCRYIIYINILHILYISISSLESGWFNDDVAGGVVALSGVPHVFIPGLDIPFLRSPVGPLLVPPVEDGEDVGGDGGWEGESQVGDDGDDLHPAGPGVVLAS